MDARTERWKMVSQGMRRVASNAHSILASQRAHQPLHSSHSSARQSNQRVADQSAPMPPSNGRPRPQNRRSHPNFARPLRSAQNKRAVPGRATCLCLIRPALGASASQMGALHVWLAGVDGVLRACISLSLCCPLSLSGTHPPGLPSNTRTYALYFICFLTFSTQTRCLAVGSAIGDNAGSCFASHCTPVEHISRVLL